MRGAAAMLGSKRWLRSVTEHPGALLLVPAGLVSFGEVYLFTLTILLFVFSMLSPIVGHLLLAGLAFRFASLLGRSAAARALAGWTSGLFFAGFESATTSDGRGSSDGLQALTGLGLGSFSDGATCPSDAGSLPRLGIRRVDRGLGFGLGVFVLAGSVDRHLTCRGEEKPLSTAKASGPLPTLINAESLVGRRRRSMAARPVDLGGLLEMSRP